MNKLVQHRRLLLVLPLTAAPWLLESTAAAAPPQHGAPVGRPAIVQTAWALQTDEDLGAGDPAWLAFRTRHPGEWHARWDTRTRTPSLLYGPGVRLAESSLDEGSDAMVHAVGLEFLDDNEELLRLRRFDLAGLPTLVGDTWILDFALSYRGVPLEEHSRVALRIKRTDGGLAALKLESIPGDLEPAFPSVAAGSALAFAARTLDPHVDVARLDGPLLTYLDDESGVGRLTWRFSISGALYGQSFTREFFVHARERAAILEEREGILNQGQGDPRPAAPPAPLVPPGGLGFSVTSWLGSILGGGSGGVGGGGGAHTYHGYVGGNVLVEGPYGNREWRYFQDAAVIVTRYGSGSAYTDLSGDFSLSVDSTNWLDWLTIKGDTSGRWCNVNNAAGNDLDDYITHAYLPSFTFDLNTLPTGHKTAQATAYYWTTRVHRWSSAIMGGNNGVERQITCNVNVVGDCNAYFDSADGSINFYDSGTCPNMAFSDVIAHEYGHAIDEGRGTILDSAYSEGFGDAVAYALTDQGLVGRGTPFTRYGTTVRLWPGTGCGTDPHCYGETYGGFTYQLMLLLKAKLGDSAGRALADRLVLLPGAANPSSIPDAVFETFVADDNDSNLNNGTPDWCEIVAAAQSRNLPIPTTQRTVDYRFDSSLNPAADSATPAHNGSTNAAFASSGGVNSSGALRFTLESPFDSFSVPDSNDLDMTGAMTGSAWIYPMGAHDTVPGDCIEGTILTKGYNYWFQVNNDNSGLMFQNDQSGAPGSFVRVSFGANYFPANVWTHVAFVRTSATSVRLYKNGVYIGGGSTLNPPHANSSPLTIGNGADNTACEFNGRIDEVQLFPRALCDAEVQSLYCAQAGCFH